ncbi:MAG: tRNA lysidine(34) synthetase TilS [Firmicutes bacterium]|nr:tRNA lysidine(34) synthetase TilS [Bacillota bacterium]MDD4336089.1 tRNA lysidine(34) synthetase TilS [Bacillota bacterium]MDD4792167.1 tRNA lysidine(34) synthetase TilS [Bacillota bacterium]
MNGDMLDATAKQCIERYSMIDPGDGIVVGVSGGPDSVALLLFLLDIATELDLRLHIAHVNHMIRGADADADADYVEELGHSLGVPVTIRRIDVPRAARTTGATIEDAGRSARYGLFRQTAKALGFAKVAVGHNADDQAETVMMRVIRGTGIRGLAGIPATRDMGEGIRLIRPLINTTRRAIEAYCKEKNINPRQDRTNVDVAYFRNRVRWELLPLLEAKYNSNVRGSLVRLALTAAEYEAYLRSDANELLEQAMAKTTAGGGEEAGAEAGPSRRKAAVQLDLAVLRGAPPALLARALATAFGMVADGEHDLYYPHVNAMCELVATGSVGDSIDLPRGVRAWLTYECLIVDQAEETDVGLSSEGASREHGDWGADYRGGDAAACAKLEVPGVTLAHGCQVKLYAAVGEVNEEPDGFTDVWRERPQPQDLVLMARRACVECGFGEMTLDPSGLGIAWVICDADKAEMDKLSVRPWEAGDRLAPFGMEGTKKVSDIFIDEKIPRGHRAQWPVVVSGGEVIWVVGLRASGIAPVDAKTRRYVVLVSE